MNHTDDSEAYKSIHIYYIGNIRTEEEIEHLCNVCFKLGVSESKRVI